MQSNWNSYNPYERGALRSVPPQEAYFSSSYNSANETINEMYSSNYDIIQQSQERERKAAHSALERQRRERMNNKIHRLRSLLPNTTHTQNMSKLDILQYSIDYINELQNIIRKSGQHLPDMRTSNLKQTPGQPPYRPVMSFKSIPQEIGFVNSRNEQNYVNRNKLAETIHPVNSPPFHSGDSFYPSQPPISLQGNSFIDAASQLPPAHYSSRMPFPAGSLTHPEDMERSYIKRLPPINNVPFNLSNSNQAHVNISTHLQTPVSPDYTQQNRYSELYLSESNHSLKTNLITLRAQDAYPKTLSLNKESPLNREKQWLPSISFDPSN
ncbi:hypothetical protein HK096_009611 [Nowakowskiella sp. JEL0078]|nr:hypothetical protein HK096_009611 [Nowakowskiella sp. JEL0078]